MRRFRLRPSSLFFRLSVAAFAFALGLAAWGLRLDAPRAPRASVEVSAKPADTSRAEVGIGDTPAADAEEEEEDVDPFFKGTYSNFAYGYSVRIPDGMIGVGSRPPAPQHGFGIDLDRPGSTAWDSAPDFPKSYLYADGSYDSLEWNTADAAADFQQRALREEAKNVRVLSRKTARLGGLRGVRVVERYVKGGEEMVNDVVVAIGGEAGAVFTLSLSTPLTKYERDRPVLEEMMESWSLQPVE